jgi:hypothetical protein
MNCVARRTSRWTPLGIAAMVLGFAVWWPIGLAVIGYILWGGSIDDVVNEGIASFKKAARPKTASSGNAAFDAYRAETLKRLEEEQAAFDEYVEKLRQARDAEEFERFMAERKNKTVDL